MQKIPSLFVRDRERPQFVTRDVTPGCEWVLAGEGVATRKWDGAACMVRGGALYKRYDAKKGKTPPPFFEPCQEPDAITGHWPGWVPVWDEPESRWFREAFNTSLPVADGTYEAVGPKIGGNAERLLVHRLLRHGKSTWPESPRDFDGLSAWIAEASIEGIVWHHPDGRMCKIKASDFGHRWPPVRLTP